VLTSSRFCRYAGAGWMVVGWHRGSGLGLAVTSPFI
jgi:hypothetical protein